MKDIELIQHTLGRIAKAGDMEIEIEGRDLEKICNLALEGVENCSTSDVTSTEEGIIELTKVIKQYGISISDIGQKNNIKRQTRRELHLCIGVLTHLREFMSGERVDPGTGTPHLTAAGECLRLLKSEYRQDSTYGGTGDYDQYSWTGS